MTENVLLFIVSLGQIFLISYYFPQKLLKSRTYIFEHYPPTEYPKLYPNPMSYYQQQQNTYKIWNQLILFTGLILAVYMVSSSEVNEWDAARLSWYFLLQVLPLLRLEIAAFREFKQMRSHLKSGIRKAELKPRRLFDYISPKVFSIAVFTYVAFVVFIIYFNQLGYPWFGGYLNIAGITLGNVFYGGIIYWYMYGKKMNPHISNEDRARQISTLANILVFISVAATISVTLNILLAASELRSFQPIAHSLYFQLLLLISFQFYRTVYYTNFEVYKEDSVLTQSSL